VDAAGNQLGGLTVASYLDQAEDAVALAVQLGTLGDGTSYTAHKRARCRGEEDPRRHPERRPPSTRPVVLTLCRGWPSIPAS